MESWKFKGEIGFKDFEICKSKSGDEDDKEMESWKSKRAEKKWKSKRADDRMHKISFHADKICHTGKYGKQPNTKYQMFPEQIISYFASEEKKFFEKI